MPVAQGSEHRWVRITAVVLLLLLVGALDLATGATVDAAFFYFLPVVLASRWFGRRGWLVVPIALALYHWNEAVLAPGAPRHLWGNTVVKLFSFSLIAVLTVQARERFRLAEAARREHLAMRQAAEARGSRLEALYRLASAANVSRGADEFLRLFLDEITRIVPHVRAITVLECHGRWLVRLAARGLPNGIGERIPLGEGIAGRVAATGEPLVLQGPDFSPAAIISPRLRDLDLTAVLGVPMQLRGETTGVVVLFGGPGADFGADEVRILHSMAAESALVLEALRLYDTLRGANEALRERQAALDEQLQLAREVQQAILSVCPAQCRTGPLAVASYHATAWEVGGDFLRIVPDSDGAAIFVGDVMGKGVPAALLMTMMTAELTSPGAPSDDAGGVLRRANQVLVDNVADRDFAQFVTVAYTHIASRDLCLRYAGAGHTPAIVMRANGEYEILYSEGIPLGILQGADYATREVPLRPGDHLVLYTDGIVEARNAERELFGSERLQEIIAAHPGAPAAELRDAIVEAVRRFKAGATQSDDMALVVVAVEG